MENNEKKNNKGLIILIVIFSLIILGLGGWMIYDKFYGNGVKPNDKNIKDYQSLTLIIMKILFLAKINAMKLTIMLYLKLNGH